MDKTPPHNNYTLEYERERIGGWSCYEIRNGDYKCDCDCKHGSNPCEFCENSCTSKGYYHKRPATMFEKLDDCHRIFREVNEWVRYRDYRLKRYKDSVKRSKESSWHEVDKEDQMWANMPEKLIKAAHCIMKFQMQAYRKVLFHEEHKLIYALCPFCKEKRFFYRLPEARRTTYPEEHIEITLDRQNNMFHCKVCHYVSYESTLDISKIKTKSKSGIGAYIDSKAGLRQYMQKFDSMMGICGLVSYYNEFCPELKKLPLEKFFIVTDHPKGGKGYQCIACKYIYKRKNMALLHLKRFWERTNQARRRGCIEGMFNLEKQQKALLA